MEGLVDVIIEQSEDGAVAFGRQDGAGGGDAPGAARSQRRHATSVAISGMKEGWVAFKDRKIFCLDY